MFEIKNLVTFRVIVFSLLISFTGCVTSKIEYTESNELPKDKVYRISDVYMKDGSIINLKGKEAKFKLKYKGVENVIVYADEKDKEVVIPVKNINNMKIEVLEGNTLVTVLIITGILIILFLVFLALAFGKGHFNIAG